MASVKGVKFEESAKDDPTEAEENASKPKTPPSKPPSTPKPPTPTTTPKNGANKNGGPKSSSVDSARAGSPTSRYRSFAYESHIASLKPTDLGTIPVKDNLPKTYSPVNTISWAVSAF